MDGNLENKTQINLQTQFSNQILIKPFQENTSLFIQEVLQDSLGSSPAKSRGSISAIKARVETADTFKSRDPVFSCSFPNSPKKSDS